ncbi:MAG: hypothetical protein J6Q22_11205 [Prevotella sp.]|nr:hypothetical protein [Prevotella sp.]
MKKVFVITISLLMAVSTFGQSIKVTPALKKGMVKTYIKTTSTTAAGQTVNITSEQTYTVTKETSDGYELTLVTSNLKSDGNNENLVSRIALLGEEMMKDSKIQLRLDKEGKVLSIINYDEVKAKSVATAKQLIDELFGLAPEIAQLMKKEQMEEQITGELTPELLTKSMTLSSSPLSLFGRTIVSGMEEKYNNNVVNLKRIWLVTGKRLGASAKTDMSREELKDYVLKQVEKVAPQQADMIKDNIDTVLESGLIKLDVNEKSSYELADDFWVKSMETTVENDMMGQKSTSSVKLQLKD